MAMCEICRVSLVPALAREMNGRIIERTFLQGGNSLHTRRWISGFVVACDRPRTFFPFLKKPSTLSANSGDQSFGNFSGPGTHTSSRHETTLTSAGSSGQSSVSQQEKGSEAQPSFLLALWQKHLVLPLSNFGFGKRSIWEGGVGIFLVAGGCLLALTLAWIRGTTVRARTSRYQAIIEFSQACGIAVGTPVRIRGVDVGSVVGVRPSLERIDTVVEIMDASVVIPRNAQVHVNQSGLISETLIDITPVYPLPRPKLGPLDEGCKEEGLIVCDREHIKGEQGVSLDELIGIVTKLSKQMDRGGVENVFNAMEEFRALADDVKPLLDKVTVMAHDLAPLLSDVRRGDLLTDLEKLTKVASEAAHDLRQLNSEVLTQENTSLLRDSVSTLTKTLKHVEKISADVSILTGDPGTQDNLKQLIESLSRLVED